MREEFQQRRGYDMTVFLPVMTGRVVDSLEISERFLWDLRRTISELVVENYAGRMHELAQAHGMRFTVEAYGCPCDCIPYGGMADEPMGEFWTPSGAMETCKGMACAGHVYGKRIMGAESFTSGDQEKWREHPGDPQGVGGHGVLRRHQPVCIPPLRHAALGTRPPPRHDDGALGPALRAHRNLVGRDAGVASSTWPAASICCGRGCSSPTFAICSRKCLRKASAGTRVAGYDWDECGAEVVLNRMSVKNGWIVLPDGMSYRLLVLPQTGTATPALLRKVRELVQAGATVMGSPA